MPTPPTPTIVGVLLAGGRSARMGEDKGALVLADAAGGETLGARAARVLAAVCDDVVCAGHGRGVPEGIARVADVGQGPLVALAGALERSARVHRSCCFVVLPVDMPGVDVRHLARLLESCLAAPPPTCAACFAAEGRIEPLPLALGADAVPRVIAMVAAGQRRLAEAVRGLDPTTIALSVGEQAMLHNLNTREDLRGWATRSRGR